VDIYSEMNSIEGLNMFRTSSRMKSFGAILGSTVIGLMLATGVDAANPETVTVEVTFVDPITISTVNALRFGLLDQNLSGVESVIIAPGGGVTDGGGNVVGGTQAPANLTITATGGQLITILVDVITDNTGYTLGTFMCNYDTAGADTGCETPGYTETTAAAGTAPLLIGVTLSGDGAAVPGVFNGSFNVTVSYQ